MKSTTELLTILAVAGCFAYAVLGFVFWRWLKNRPLYRWNGYGCYVNVQTGESFLLRDLCPQAYLAISPDPGSTPDGIYAVVHRLIRQRTDDVIRLLGQYGYQFYEVEHEAFNVAMSLKVSDRHYIRVDRTENLFTEIERRFGRSLEFQRWIHDGEGGVTLEAVDWDGARRHRVVFRKIDMKSIDVLMALIGREREPAGSRIQKSGVAQ